MRCLARVGGDEAVQALVGAYDADTDIDERETILELLGRFAADPRVADRLKIAAENPKFSSSVAVKGLSQTGDPEEQADYFISKLLSSTGSVAKDTWMDGLGRLAQRGSSKAEAALVNVIRTSPSAGDRLIAFRVLSSAGKLASLSANEISELEANK
ncbi:MAG: hypothetical protein K8T20_10635 [Planctomycetes bacterium]|nr:hypothetical protein [Planctomycetota bacterium]